MGRVMAITKSSEIESMAPLPFIYHVLSSLYTKYVNHSLWHVWLVSVRYRGRKGVGGSDETEPASKSEREKFYVAAIPVL